MDNIKVFDINNLKKTSTIIIIGKRSTGKTTLIKNILSHIDDKLTKYIIFDPYLDHKNEFKYIEEKSKIYDMYDEDILKINMNHKNDENKIIIIDNALYSPEHNKTMQNHFMNCRFYEIGIILSVSYGAFIHTNVISNTDFIFIFRESNQSNQNYLYNRYFKSLFISFELFIVFFKMFLLLCETTPYTCLVISNIAKTDNLKDKLFIYKAL